MKILITGGTGFIGSALVEFLKNRGYSIYVITRRDPELLPQKDELTYIQADPTVPGPWQDCIREHDVIINLAGESIFKRWTKKVKERIRESRILTTRNLIEPLINATGEVKLFITASAVGYYGFHGDERLGEDCRAGNDFLAEVCVQWEEEAKRAEDLGIRTSILRIGIVLGRGGGIIKVSTPIFKWNLGAPFGKGKQFMSWIHLEDLMRIFEFVIKRDDLCGPINCASPNAVTNREFTKTMGSALKKFTIPFGIPPLFLKLFMGEFSDLLLNGQRAYPERLLKEGFRFRFEYIEDALNDIFGRALKNSKLSEKSCNFGLF